MPLARRVAKRGFNNNYFAVDVAEVNLKDLEQAFSQDEVVDAAALRKHGLARNTKVSVRILGNGTLTKRLVVRANHFSQSAEKAIVACGGRAERIGHGEASTT
jgi:large subunit ribosomal protein L15